MKRFLLIGVVITCGLFWLATGAPACGGDPPNDNEPMEENCDLSDPECLARRQAEQGSGLPVPNPEEDAKVKEILFQDPVVQTLTAKRELNQDMWIVISHMPGLKEAMVDLYFNPPVTYEGQVPLIIDPCSGKAGPDEILDADEPCRSKPKGHTYVDVNWERTFVLHAQLDRTQTIIVSLFRGPQPEDASEFPFFPSSAP